MILENTDNKLGITLKGNGVALPYSSLNDYAFIIYKLCSGVKQQIAVFKKSFTGIYAIVIDGSITNKAYIVLNRETTKGENYSDLYLETFVQLTADSQFIDMKQNAGTTGVSLDKLIKAANNNVF